MDEYLDSVDWGVLQQAYEDTDIPGHLRELNSPDREVREHALYRLEDTRCHQGSLFEAALYAIPYLHQLLSDSGAPGKEQALTLLQLIYRGASWRASHEPRLPAEKKTPDYYAQMATELTWSERARRDIEEAAPIYLALAADGEQAVRWR